MNKIKNWIKINNGFTTNFKYIVNPNLCYEIVTDFWYEDTPIETARASLYKYVRTIPTNPNNEACNIRILIHELLPVFELAEVAYDDYKNNLKNKNI